MLFALTQLPCHMLRSDWLSLVLDSPSVLRKPNSTSPHFSLIRFPYRPWPPPQLLRTTSSLCADTRSGPVGLPTAKTNQSGSLRTGRKENLPPTPRISKRACRRSSKMIVPSWCFLGKVHFLLLFCSQGGTCSICRIHKANDGTHVQDRYRARTDPEAIAGQRAHPRVCPRRAAMPT